MTVFNTEFYEFEQYVLCVASHVIINTMTSTGNEDSSLNPFETLNSNGSSADTPIWFFEQANVTGKGLPDVYMSASRFRVETAVAIIAAGINLLTVVDVLVAAFSRRSDRRRADSSRSTRGVVRSSRAYERLFVNITVANVFSSAFLWMSNNAWELFGDGLQSSGDLCQFLCVDALSRLRFYVVHLRRHADDARILGDPVPSNWMCRLPQRDAAVDDIASMRTRTPLHRRRLDDSSTRRPCRPVRRSHVGRWPSTPRMRRELALQRSGPHHQRLGGTSHRSLRCHHVTLLSYLPPYPLRSSRS